jgi:hypothetical protein
VAVAVAAAAAAAARPAIPLHELGGAGGACQWVCC